MTPPSTRRTFLHDVAASSALLGLGGVGFLQRLPAVSAADATLDPKLVRLESGIEPLVRLLEETPRDRLLEEVASGIQKGLSYREVLTALFLAGVRNIRPAGGNNFHAVLAIHAAHQASQASPDRDRWLPVFWALDEFKQAQAVNLAKDKGWRMGPVDEAKLPPARKARAALLEAIDQWNGDAAELAVAQLARTAGAAELFDLFALPGARNFLGLGHDAIYVANGWRTLQCIGWQHAEPVLRSLSRVIFNRNGAPKDDLTVNHFAVWQRNRELAAQVPAGWQEGKPSAAATTDLLAVMRQASPTDASAKVLELLKAGVAPQSIWDAVFVGVAELLMRWPGPADRWPGGVLPLHAVTSTNAVFYAYSNSGQEETRRLLLLQAGAIVPFFLESGRRRVPKERVGEGLLEQLEALPLKEAGPAASGEIFAEVNKNRKLAVRKALTYLTDPARARELIDAARLLIFLKGSDTHDYKFSSAVFEDYSHVSPAWRNRYLASSLYILRGSADKDNPLVSRTRAALKT